MATEIAILPLREGVSLDNSTSPASQTFQGIVQTIKAQKGFQRLYWGQEKKNSTNLRVFIDWDSVEDHVAFSKTEHYQPFMDNLGQLFDMSQSHICHINATPHPPLALSEHVSPVTEILSVYFPSEYSDSDRAKFEEVMNEVFATLKKQEIYTGSAGGWTIGDVPVPDTADKGKAYQALIGWESLEAFQTFRQTETFSEVLSLLKSAKDTKGMTIVFYTGKLEDKDS